MESIDENLKDIITLTKLVQLSVEQNNPQRAYDYHQKLMKKG
jgi:hypothetical protein